MMISLHLIGALWPTLMSAGVNAHSFLSSKDSIKCWSTQMMSLITMMTIVSLLGVILVAVGVSLSTKFQLDREKSSPFECGFTPKSMPRLPLSLRFFLIAIVFLIFDVELVLIFPVIISQSTAEPLISSLLLLIFIIILSLGLYYEINQGSINWAS